MKRLSRGWTDRDGGKFSLGVPSSAGHPRRRCHYDSVRLVAALLDMPAAEARPVGV